MSLLIRSLLVRWAVATHAALLVACATGPAKVSDPLAPGYGRRVDVIAASQTPHIGKCNSAPRQSAFDAEIAAEINQLRADPPRYARYVRDRFASMDASGIFIANGKRIKSHEGLAAVTEATSHLQATPPLSALALASCISLAAQAHATEQGRSGLMGHVGTDGSLPSDRVERFAGVKAYCGEVISYGPTTARDVVIDFLVDDNVSSRGHRGILLDSRYKSIGAAAGRHSSHSMIAVVVMCLNPA